MELLEKVLGTVFIALPCLAGIGFTFWALVKQEQRRTEVYKRTMETFIKTSKSFQIWLDQNT